jgi:hypothetical protein
MSGLEPAEMRRLIGRTRELTDRPFGVNVIIDEEGWAASEEDMEHLRVTHRDPGHVLDRHGLLVVGQHIRRRATDPAQRHVQRGKHARHRLVPRREDHPEARPGQPRAKQLQSPVAADTRLR